jgi:hypothetical protein
MCLVKIKLAVPDKNRLRCANGITDIAFNILNPELEINGVHSRAKVQIVHRKFPDNPNKETDGYFCI